MEYYQYLIFFDPGYSQSRYCDTAFLYGNCETTWIFLREVKKPAMFGAEIRKVFYAETWCFSNPAKCFVPKPNQSISTAI